MDNKDLKPNTNFDFQPLTAYEKRCMRTAIKQNREQIEEFNQHISALQKAMSVCHNQADMAHFGSLIAETQHMVKELEQCIALQETWLKTK